MARTWGGKVPLEHAVRFHGHILRMGVADDHKHSECLEAHLQRQHEDRWASFLTSVAVEFDAIREYVGEAPWSALLCPGDKGFGLGPDTTVTHDDVLVLGWVDLA
jgi:hypothetical protein